MQEQTGEERRVAKSKSTAMNLSSHVPTRSLSAISPIAFKSPGIVIATGKPEDRMRRNSKSDAASSSHARLQDAYFGGLMDTATVKLIAAKEDFRIWNWEWRRCHKETGCLQNSYPSCPWYCVENFEKINITCTTSTPWWSSNRRSSSLECFVFKATTWFQKWRRSNLLWLSMAGLYTQRKQQTQISILRKLEQQPLVCLRHPRPLRRRVSWLLLKRWIILQFHQDGKNSCIMWWEALLGWQTVFFTALDPTGDETEEEYDDLPNPRKGHCKNKWKVSQEAVYWVKLENAQEKGLQFWQTRSHAIILHDSVLTATTKW